VKRRGKKWFRSGDEKRQAKYEGEIVTGAPNGWGTITFPSGSKYVGEFKDGKRTGQGTMSFFDGGKYKGKYEGKWKDGRKMVKEQKLTLVEESMKGNGRIINLGREHYTTERKKHWKNCEWRATKMKHSTHHSLPLYFSFHHHLL
jgi:Uncharacterized protein conserved in bacteria